MFKAYIGKMESPDVFVEWVGVSIVSGVLGRNVWLPRGLDALLPGQMMVVLVSGSGVCRKSSAINAGLSLLSLFRQELGGGKVGVNVMPNKMSSQSLLSNLRTVDEDGETCNTGYIVATELTTLISQESFTESLIDNIISLNDTVPLVDPDDLNTLLPKEWRSSFKKDGPITFINPCVGLLGATTPRMVHEGLPKQVRDGGLFGRVLWVYARDSKKPPNSMLLPSETISEWRAPLIEGLLRMGELRGYYRFSKQAFQWADDWYVNIHYPEVQARGEEDGLWESGYYHRRQDHLLRIGIILSAMESDEKLIKVRHLEHAWLMLQKVQRGVHKLFEQVVESKGVTVMDAILRVFKKPKYAQLITWADLCKLLWRVGSVGVLEEALRNLELGGKVEVDRTKSKMAWKIRPVVGTGIHATPEYDEPHPHLKLVQ
jgi:hypothetical protein